MGMVSMGWRAVRRNPGLAAAAVLTLGVGIGLVATQCSLIEAVLLRPFPFPKADRLVHVAGQGTGNGGQSWRELSLREFIHLREHQEVFEDFAGFQARTLNLLRAGGVPRRLSGRAVTSRFFGVLGEACHFGRTFGPGEDQPGAPRVAILAHRLWVEEFGGDTNVVGASVSLNGEPATVIGVARPGFQFPVREECWINLEVPLSTVANPRTGDGVEAMGRLREGISAGQAMASLGTLLGNLPRSAAEDHGRPPAVEVRGFTRAYNNGSTVTLLYLMLAMTGFVLLLACGNVAGLLLVRALSRSREMAIRTSLGATRIHLGTMVLAEGTILTIGAALVGVALACGGVRALDAYATAYMDLPWWIRFEMNPRVLLAVLGIAIVAGAAACGIPSWRAASADLRAILQETSRSTASRRGRFRSQALAALQVGFATALVIVGALLALSAVRSGRTNLKYAPDSLLVGRLELHGSRYEQADARVRFYQRLLEEVRVVPGVEAAAVSSRDLVNPAVYAEVEFEGVSEGGDRSREGGWLEVVSHDYFRVLNQGAVVGRLFQPEDGVGSPAVAVVNESFVRRFWPQGDVIGRRLRRGGEQAAWATVIGVVPDLGMEGLGNRDPEAGWYLLQDQQAWGWLDLLVRVDGNASALAGAVRQAVSRVDSGQPIHSIGSLAARSKRRVAGLEIVGTMSTVFAASAVVLAMVGVYGVLAFSVRQRRREIGIRLALGASSGRILGRMMGVGLVVGGVGVALGALGGYLLLRPLGAILPGVATDDPRYYFAALVFMMALTGLAVSGPARAAASVDPAITLRDED